MNMNKKLIYLGVILAITAVMIPTGLSYAKEFTMFGNTFDENSECAEWALKYLQAVGSKPYNLDQVQPAMMLGEKRCNPNP